ncbi:hypothetical protein LY78DRAFT_254962 [Colletotrichum sublineola]|nr:hypothetical protein LY78DRAFT_254962 [Colletotrichum sublineola]
MVVRRVAVVVTFDSSWVVRGKGERNGELEKGPQRRSFRWRPAIVCRGAPKQFTPTSKRKESGLILAAMRCFLHRLSVALGVIYRVPMRDKGPPSDCRLLLGAYGCVSRGREDLVGWNRVQVVRVVQEWSGMAASGMRLFSLLHPHPPSGHSCENGGFPDWIRAAG